jgi:cell division protein ZapA (FtsZ GTPase activity inhibitor)
MSRRTLFILMFVMVLICGLGVRSATADGASERIARCQKLKSVLSPPAQQNLSLAEQKFGTDTSGRKALSSSELRSLAQAAIRGRFRRATSSQVDVLAAILLSDWATKKQLRIERLRAAKRTQSQGKGNDLGELMNADLQTEEQDYQQAVETIADIQKIQEDDAESIIRNLKD